MMLSADDAPALPLWINGRAFLTMAPSFLDVVGGPDGRVLRKIPLCGADEVETAVSGARLALGAWNGSDGETRRGCLTQLGESLGRYRDHFAKLLGEETGRDGADCAAEVDRALALLARIQPRDAAPLVAGLLYDHQAPLLAPLVLSAQVLADGGVAVLKPSTKAPSCGVALAELWTRAGLPDGVCNLVQGDEAAVLALAAHPGVDRLALAGAATWRQKVMQRLGTKPVFQAEAADGLGTAWAEALASN